jgi:hypothetical protein
MAKGIDKGRSTSSHEIPRPISVTLGGKLRQNSEPPPLLAQLER